jgi:hypothetical protein
MQEEEGWLCKRPSQAWANSLHFTAPWEA